MVEFVTVLIGLMTGLHPVELTVVGPVAQVEARLDGRTVTVLEGPPWRFGCDFGTQLAPHRLEVIARDADGVELSRAERWINVEMGSAGAEMSLVSDQHGKPTAVRLAWESIGQLEPRSIEVMFDNQQLEVVNPRHIALPSYDLEDFHFVTATLHFDDHMVSYLQAGFGGVLGDELETELTAIAVDLDRRRLPSAEDMAGWIEAESQPLTVHGTEKGAKELLVVRDPSIQPQLDALAWYVFDRSSSDRESGRRTGAVLAGILNEGGRQGVGFMATEQQKQRLRGFAALGRDAKVRFVAPASAPVMPAGVQSEIFLHSPSFDADQAGFGQLALTYPPQSLDVRLADAVALAGMVAHSTRSRRAVLLLLGERSLDSSRYEAAAVQQYLRDLGVPLFVARFGDGEPDAAWGEVLDLGNLDDPGKAQRQFERALGEVAQALDRQRLIWLVGRHLPQRIELAPAAAGIRLSGR